MINTLIVVTLELSVSEIGDDIVSKLFARICFCIMVMTPISASAQNCGCTTMPYEGSYLGAEDPLVIKYLAPPTGSGLEFPCPTQMHIDGNRLGGPHVDVILTCEPTTNSWIGIEQTSWQGVPLTFGWRIKPPAFSGGNAQVSLVPGSMSMIDNILVDLDIPQMAKAAGHKDRRDIAMTLSGSSVVPSCICDHVRAEYDFVSEQVQLYSDLQIISNANYADARGNNPSERFWLNDQGELVKFGTTGTTQSYDDLVNSANNPGPSKNVRTSTAQQKAAAGFKLGALTPGALAATNPGSCKITPPSPALVAAECIPDIVVQAALVHEGEHQKMCRAMNSKFPQYSYNGTPVDWDSVGRASGLGGVYYPLNSATPVRLPLNAYVAWSQKPENQSADEQAAYSAEQAVLKSWLDTNCP